MNWMTDASAADARLVRFRTVRRRSFQTITRSGSGAVCECSACSDGSPARTAVLRGQRQRDLSLWTPICRLRAGRGLDVLICFCCFIPHKRRQSETAVTANFYECKYIPWIKGNRPAAARAGPSAAGSGVHGYSRGAAQDKLRGKIAG